MVDVTARLGNLTEREGLVQLTSLYYLVWISSFYIENTIYLFNKTSYLNCTDPSLSVRVPRPDNNTVAYYSKELITAVKSFMIQRPLDGWKGDSENGKSLIRFWRNKWDKKLFHHFVLDVFRVTRLFGKIRPIFLKKVAKTVAKQNNAKLETIFKWLI